MLDESGIIDDPELEAILAEMEKGSTQENLDLRLILSQLTKLRGVLETAFQGAPVDSLGLEILMMNRQDQLSAASNPDANPEFLDRISQQTRFPEVLAEVAKNSRINPKTALFLSNSQNEAVILNLAANPASDERETLEQLVVIASWLFYERYADLRKRVRELEGHHLYHGKNYREWRDFLLEEEEKLRLILVLVAERRSLSVFTCQQIITIPIYHNLWKLLIKNPITPLEFLQFLLAENSHPEYIEAVQQHPNYSEALPPKDYPEHPYRDRG